MGDLCKLYFDIEEVGGGVSASIQMSTVALKDFSGNDLANIGSPPIPSTSIDFAYGDTLSLGDMLG